MDSIDTLELEGLDELIATGDAALIPEQGIVISLNTGKEVVPRRKRQGRPLVHLFGGRVTLTLEERTQVLEDTEAFMGLMTRTHTISEGRLQQLHDEGLVLDGVDELNFTFKGPIKFVVSEVKAKMEQYKDALGVQANFHKVKMISNPSHPLYVEPVVDEIEGKRKRFAHIECNPDVLYGYLTVMVPREG